MNEILDTTTAGLAALTMAVVALIRKHFPKLDGPLVLLAVLGVAAALVLGTTPVTNVQVFVVRVVAVFMAAAGTNALASSWALKAAPATLQGGELLVASVDETARPGDSGQKAKDQSPPAGTS